MGAPVILEVLAGGAWWRVQDVFTDGFEIVIGRDDIDGQLILRWVPASLAEMTRIA